MELYHLILVGAFIAGLLGVEALYGVWSTTQSPEARRVERRLRLMSAGGHVEEASDLFKKRDLSRLPRMERALLSLPRIRELDKLLVQAGSSLSVTSLLGLTLSLFIIGVILGLGASGFLLVGIVLGFILGSIPGLWVLRKKIKRMHALLRQLPDALDLMARSLRAGHAYSGALKMVADEMSEPIAGEFRTVFEELNFGLPLEVAMSNLAERVELPDIRFFVVSVLIQRETGGNLAEILDNISRLIRERLKLLGRVQVLSAQGRMEAWILSILPFVVAGILFIIAPEIMSVLWTDPTGQVLMAVALVMMLIGFVVMWRMIRIHI